MRSEEVAENACDLTGVAVAQPIDVHRHAGIVGLVDRLIHFAASLNSSVFG